MPPPYGNSCQHLAGFLGVAQSNFEKSEDFSPDSSLQLADATVFKFNYIPLRIWAFPLPRGSVTALKLRIWRGREREAVLAEERKIILQRVCFHQGI